MVYADLKNKTRLNNMSKIYFGVPTEKIPEKIVITPVGIEYFLSLIHI